MVRFDRLRPLNVNLRVDARDPNRLRGALVATARYVLLALTRVHIDGLDHIPRTGPLLMIANHQSNADSFFLYVFLPRVVRFMTKEELFLGPLGPLAWWFGGFPVRRGRADRKAIRVALDLLAAGECVGMYPEGKRSEDGQLSTAQAGAGLVGVRSGALVLPVAIVGTRAFRHWSGLLTRPRIHLTIGEPFTVAGALGQRYSPVTATNVMMSHLAAYLPPGMRGPYAKVDLGD